MRARAAASTRQKRGGRKTEKGETSVFAPARRGQKESSAHNNNLFPRFPNFSPAPFRHFGRLPRRLFLATPPHPPVLRRAGEVVGPSAGLSPRGRCRGARARGGGSRAQLPELLPLSEGAGSAGIGRGLRTAYPIRWRRSRPARWRLAGSPSY